MADQSTGRRLYRSDDAILAGVCAGIAEYFSTSKTLIRVIASILFVVGIGSPILVYIVMALVVPRKPSDFTRPVDVVPCDMDGVAIRTDSRASSPAAPIPPVASSSPVVSVSSVAVPAASSAASEAGGASEAPAASTTSAAPATSEVPAASETSANPATPAVSASSAASQAPAVSGAAPTSEDVAQPLGAGYSATYGKALDVSHLLQNRRRWYSWPFIVLGVLLFCLGGYLLLSKAAPGVAPWRFWPVFVILCGAVIALAKGGHAHRSVMRAVVGLLVIGIGVVLLLCTLGVFGWGVWYSIVALWPLALIGVGVVVIGLSLHSGIPEGIGAAVLASMLVIGCVNYHLGMHVLAPDDSIVQNSSGLYRTKTVTEETPITLSLSEYGITDLDFEYVLGGTEAYVCSDDDDSVDVYGGGNIAQVAFYEPDTVGRGGLVVVRRKSSAASTVLSPTVCLPEAITWGTLMFDGNPVANLCVDLTDLSVGNVDVEAQVTDLDVVLSVPAGDDHVFFIGNSVTQLGLEIPADAPVSIYIPGSFSATGLGDSFHYDASSGCWVNDAYEDAVYSGGSVWYVVAAYGTQTLTITDGGQE